MHQTQTTQSTQQNRIGRNKLTIEIIASAFIVISAILPFLNNIVGHFMNVNVQLSNNAGERRLDLDSSIYFLSISLSFILLSLGGLFKAHRFTYYAALVAGYFHLITYIKFIFFNQNKVSAIADFAIIVLLIIIVFLIFKLDNYYRKLSLLDKFNTSTLTRFTSLLYKRNNIK